jgi:hypothetical protein
MNYVVAALLWHSSEEVAFDLAIRLLNEYHLKEVHMSQLIGFRIHCQVIEHLIAQHLPAVAATFTELQVSVSEFTPSWILCLFTQTIPLELVPLFLDQFWLEEWIAVYKLILLVLEEASESLVRAESSITVLCIIQENRGKTDWERLLKKLLTGYQSVTEEAVREIRSLCDIL